MWVDDLPIDNSWTSFWSGYIRCGNCSSIRTFDDPCAACVADLPEEGHTPIVDDGQEIPVPSVYTRTETGYGRREQVIGTLAVLPSHFLRGDSVRYRHGVHALVRR